MRLNTSQEHVTQPVALLPKTHLIWKVYLCVAPYVVILPFVAFFVLFYQPILAQNNGNIPSNLVMGMIIYGVLLVIPFLLLVLINSVTLICGLVFRQFVGWWKAVAYVSLVISLLPIVFVGYALVAG